MSTTNTIETKKTKRPNGWKDLQPRCGECGYFRAMSYTDTGDDAFCGRCNRNTTRLGRVRSSNTMACESYDPRKEE